jgi:hypothetical protein
MPKPTLSNLTKAAIAVYKEFEATRYLSAFKLRTSKVDLLQNLLLPPVTPEITPAAVVNSVSIPVDANAEASVINAEINTVTETPAAPTPEVPSTVEATTPLETISEKLTTTVQAPLIAETNSSVEAAPEHVAVTKETSATAEANPLLEVASEQAAVTAVLTKAKSEEDNTITPSTPEAPVPTNTLTGDEIIKILPDAPVQSSESTELTNLKAAVNETIPEVVVNTVAVNNDKPATENITPEIDDIVLAENIKLLQTNEKVNNSSCMYLKNLASILAVCADNTLAVKNNTLKFSDALAAQEKLRLLMVEYSQKFGYLPNKDFQNQINLLMSASVIEAHEMEMAAQTEQHSVDKVSLHTANTNNSAALQAAQNSVDELTLHNIQLTEKFKIDHDKAVKNGVRIFELETRYTNEINALKHQMKELSEKSLINETRNKDLSLANTTLGGLLDQKDSLLTDTNLEYNEINSKYSELFLQHQVMRNQFSVFNNASVKKIDGLQSQLQSTQVGFNSMSSEIDSLKNDLNKALVERTQADAQHQTELTCLRQELDSAIKEKNNFSVQFKNSRSDASSSTTTSNAKIAHLQLLLQSSNTNVDSMTGEINRLKKEKSNLIDQFDTINKDSSRTIIASKNSIESMQSQLEASNARIMALSSEVDKLKIALEKASRDHADADTQHKAELVERVG